MNKNNSEKKKKTRKEEKFSVVCSIRSLQTFWMWSFHLEVLQSCKAMHKKSITHVLFCNILVAGTDFPISIMTLISILWRVVHDLFCDITAQGNAQAVTRDQHSMYCTARVAKFACSGKTLKNLDFKNCFQWGKNLREHSVKCARVSSF